MNQEQINTCRAFSLGQYEKVVGFMDDFIKWDFVGMELMLGKSSVVTFCEKLSDDMKGTFSENTLELVDGDRMMIKGYCAYTRPDGNPGRVIYCDIYHVENNRLTTISSFAVEESKS